MFPRFVTPFGANAILTMETNADDVYKYTDTNGDGRRRQERAVHDAASVGRQRGASQQASLFWAMDNWLYSTVNAFRLRWTPNGVLREPTGRTAHSGARRRTTTASRGSRVARAACPAISSFRSHYGNFSPPDQFAPGLDDDLGRADGNGDMQGGMPVTACPMAR